MRAPAGNGLGGRHEPMLYTPAVVNMTLGVLVAVHLLRLMLPDAWDWRLVMSLGVIPARYFGNVDVVPTIFHGPLALILPLLGHSLLHGGFVHLGLNGVWLLAIGTPVARRLGALRFLLFYALTAVLGVGTYILLNAHSEVPVIGASAAISGLFGAVARLYAAGSAGQGGRANALTLNRRVWLFAIVWLGLNALIGLSAGMSDMAPIAWEAHAGGFIAGLLIFPLFDRKPRETAD